MQAGFVFGRAELDGAARETRTLILLRGTAPKAGVSTSFTTAS